MVVEGFFFLDKLFIVFILRFVKIIMRMYSGIKRKLEIGEF